MDPPLHLTKRELEKIVRILIRIIYSKDQNETEVKKANVEKSDPKVRKVTPEKLALKAKKVI